MTNANLTEDEVFARANEFLRTAPREELLALLRRANALPDAPQLGDKVRAYDKFGDPRYAVLVGVDKPTERWMVVQGNPSGAALTSLEDFTRGDAAELIDRAPADQQALSAKAAIELIGRPTDLSDFAPSQLPRPASALTRATLAAAALALGLVTLAFAANWLARDKSWDEETGRYRDRRGRFTS